MKGSFCNIIPPVVVDGKSVPSLLFMDLLDVTRNNRWEAATLYSAIKYNPKFKETFGKGRVDMNGEPKLFDKAYFLSESGEPIPLMAGTMEGTTEVHGRVAKRMMGFLDKHIPNLTSEIKNFFTNLGFKRASMKTPVKKQLEGATVLESAYAVAESINSNPVHTFAYIFDNYLTRNQKAEMFEAYGVDLQEDSQDKLDDIRYQMTLDYIAYRHQNRATSEKTAEVFAKIQPLLATMNEHSSTLTKFFALIDRGFFTEGIAMDEYVLDAGDMILRIMDDFGTQYDTLEDAVNRFRVATRMIKATIRDQMYYPGEIAMKDNPKSGMFYFRTREEAEITVKRMLLRAKEALEKEVIRLYGTTEPNIGRIKDVKIVKKYYEAKAAYDNYDKLLSILYPHKSREHQEIDVYADALTQELEDMMSNNKDKASLELNINAETIGSENFDSERSQAPIVKDFLATIRRPYFEKVTSTTPIAEGEETVMIDNVKHRVKRYDYIKPRYAYLLTAKLLKGLDYANDDDFWNEVSERTDRMGGQYSDAWYVANALYKLNHAIWSGKLMFFDKSKSTGLSKTNVGRFENESYYVTPDGRPITRKKGEHSGHFYLRIAKITGLPNEAIVYAGQRFLNADILVSLVSHFSSLKEANYHFLETADKNFLTNIQYRKGKTQGISSAIVNTIMEKMTDVASETVVKNGKSVNKLKSLFETALAVEISDAEKELIKKNHQARWSVPTYKQYLVAYRFLEQLGLNHEANMLRTISPKYSKIEGHFQHMGKRIDEAVAKYDKELKVYEKAQEKLSTLTAEQKTEAMKNVYKVFDNERKAKQEQKRKAKEEKLANALSVETLAAEPQQEVEEEGTTLTFDNLTENEKIVYNALRNKNIPELNIRNIVQSIANDYADALMIDNEQQKPSSIISKDKTKKYTMHNSSNAWGLVQKLIRYGTNPILIKDALSFAKSAYYQKNLFVSGFNRVFDWEDFDFTRHTDWRGQESEFSYKEERFTGWFTRVFNGMFADTLYFDKKEEVPVYSQVFPTISNRPTSFSVRVKALSETELVDAIAQTIDQMRLRDGSKYTNTRYNENSTLLFEVLAPYVKKSGGIKKLGDSKTIAKQIYDTQLEEMALRLAEKFVEQKLPLHQNLISPNMIRLMNPETKVKAERLANNSGGTTTAVRFENNVLKYSFTPQDLVPVLKIFVANHYVNSYHLVQMTMGDPAFFKDAADIVKRSSGAHAPGVKGLVNTFNDHYGMKEKFRVVMAEDISADGNVIESSLKRLGFEGEDLKAMLSLYPEGYEESDGFGVMLPHRRRDLTRGFGTSYGVTHISKPAHYEITEDGSPVMMKYSSLELTDELVAKYPKLKTLRKNLEVLGADEMVFRSGIKVGATMKGIDVETLMTRELGEGNMVNNDLYFLDNNEKLDWTESVLTLSNQSYRLQHNPYHDLEGSVANPTQLAYFLNVLDENVELAARVYSSMGEIIRRRLDNFNRKGIKGMKKDFAKSLKGKGNERIREYIEEDISLQFPGIEKEAFTKIASMFKKNVIQIRFPKSQKLVAQADVGITKQIFQDGKWVTTNEKLKTYLLNQGKPNESRVSECIIPRGALPKEVEEQVIKRIESGEEVFASGGDALAFRIPSSELHSAVSVRVAGFFEPMTLDGKVASSNMMIVPTDLMPIIGHDYDIDSFFIIQRQWAMSDANEKVYPGYTRNKDGSFTFNKNTDTSEMNDQEFEAFHMNNVIESFLESIERPGPTRKRTSAPISFRIIEDDIKKIEEIVKPDKAPLDLSDPLGNYKAFESSFNGAQGVGIIANAMKALAYSVRANNGGYPTFQYKKIGGKEEPRISFNGKVLDVLDEGKDQLVNLWMSLDGLLNAAIDNVKVQILPRLNIGDNTFKAFIAARALGVDMETSHRFMLQPVLTALSSIQDRREVTRKINSLIEAASRLNDKTAEATEATETKKADIEIIDLNKEELENSLKIASEKKIDSIEKILESGNEEFIRYQGRMAQAYLQLNTFGNSISDLSGYLSIVKELPVTITDMQKYMNRRKKIISEDGSMNSNFRMEIPNFFAVNPHIAQLDKVLTQFWKTIQSNFAIHSAPIEDMVDEITSQMKFSGMEEEVSVMVKEEYQKYILAVIEDTDQYRWDKDFSFDDVPPTTNPRSNLKVTGREAFSLHMVDMVDALKKKFPQNKFIGLLSSAKHRTGGQIQMHGAHTMEFEDYLELRSHFLELSNFRYDISGKAITSRSENDTDQYSNIQKFFVHYAVMEYGLKFGTKNFSLVFPPDIFRELDQQYAMAVSDHRYRNVFLKDFMVQLAFNNAESVQYHRGKAEFKGFDQTLNTYYDLKIEEPEGPEIIRRDDMYDDRADIKFYAKVTNADGIGTLYQEIGKEPQKWYYQKPSETSFIERFRPDMLNFKVFDVNDVPYISPKQPVKIGDTISVTAYNDPMRNNRKFYRVKDVQDGKALVEPTDNAKEFNPMDTLITKQVEVGGKKSGSYRKLKAILNTLTKRTGIKNEIYTNEQMVDLTGREGIKGHFGKDGIVYINSDLVTNDTPFHEFIHPFIAAVEKENPALYRELVKEIHASDVGQATLASVRTRYKERDGKYHIQEAIVELAGKYAARAHEVKKTGLNRLLERLWNVISSYVRNLIESKETVVPAKLQKMTLQEIGVLFAIGENDFELRIGSQPSHDSRIEDIVTEGKRVTVETAPEGKESNVYKDEKGNAFQRLTTFAEAWLDRKIAEKEKSYAEYKADKLWDQLGVDKETAVHTDLNDAGPLTYKQYLERLEEMMEKGRIKGKVIHKLLQLAVEPHNEAQIRTEISSINAKGLVKAFETNWVTEKADKILERFGINLRKDIPEEKRDKVQSEVTVAVKELGLAGTMDMLVEHPDGTFSILEWKSGKSFMDRKFVNLLRKGDQLIDIMDNPMERAKLQAALYAVMLKMNYPDIKFRDIQVGWVNSERTTFSRSTNNFVEVDSYIPMIRDLLTDPDMQKQLGIDPKAMEKLDPKGKLFRVSEYSNYHSSSIEDLLQKGKSVEEVYEIKMNRLLAFQAQMDLSKKGIKGLEKEEQVEYFKLVEEIAEIKKDPKLELKQALSKDNDIGLFTRAFGNAADVRNPLVRLWNKVRNERLLKADVSYRQKMNTFRALLDTVMTEIRQEQGFVDSRTFGVMTGNYKQMFAWAYKYDEKEGRHRVRRFVTKNDPEFRELSKAKQELLNYMNDTIYSYFGPSGFLNNVVLQVEGKGGRMQDLTHLDIINRYTGDKDKAFLDYGFMPKVAVTREEMMSKFGKGSILAGAFSPKYLQELWKRSTSFYEENNYEKWDVEEQALPIKFLGSPEIEASEDYTENIELIFSRWVQHMEHKQNMDHVYALGKGVYNMMTDLPEKEQLSNTASWLDDILVKDIQGRMKQTEWLSKMVRAKSGDKSKQVSIDKLLMFLNKWASSVVMQFRPFTATGNTIHGMILQARRGAVGSISKFQGMETGFVDYTLEDLGKAEIEYMKLVKDAASGNIRSNRLYLIAKELNYHPNSSIYSNSREFISLRNKVLDPSMQYIMHTIGEEYLSYTVMAAQLSAMKLKDGRSVLDAYQVVKDAHGASQLKWTGGVRGYEQSGTGIAAHRIPIEGLTAREVARLKRVYENQQGSYRREELAAIEVYAIGKMFTSLKRYLHRVLFVGFHSTMDDDALGRYIKTGEEVDGIPVYEWEARRIEGRYWVISKAIMALATNGTIYSEYAWKKLNAEARQTMLDFMLTMAFLATSYAAYVAMFYDDDDTDTYKKFWKRYFVDNPSQHYNLVDVVRNPGQMVPVGISRVSQSASSLAKMLAAVATYGVTGNESDMITQRGDLRGWNEFKKGVPFIAPATDFISKMKNQDMISWFDDDDNYRR